ncbi:DUF6279 family lipoprotein [Colwellia hornerae]|uniref:Lipoprotein n=1 Tax=Colwellia hornerae TaxID=89402 RepID=A0A5C6QJV6_9GAMM|nr:DUF6279 family lipoprotein [Colwellia hornerae]TWX53400.1 hypothetical protein ESZ28_10145 [Colwellia hornerae]TWX60220.1 hypothetical protein ESZ26_08920 [Colwellia hornerae]TWX68987.1 hypothetical protein ESZ27_06510 [Colwellia hornerae]
MQRIIKNGIVVIFSAFLLSACSFSFIYNHLDWWSNWYLDDYVTLSQDQQQRFDTAFNELHTWHRQTQLSEYTRQLITLKTQVNRGITLEEVNAQLVNLKQHWLVVREQAKPALISLVHSLSSRQRKQVVDEIASNNEARIDDYDEISQEQWFSETCIERQDQFKKWLGKLTKGQKVEVCQLAKSLTPTFNHRMYYLIKWHSGLKQVLAMGLDKQQYEVMFTELISEPESLKSEQHKTLSKNNSDTSVKIFQVMMNSLTDKQLNRLNNKLDDLIKDLKELAIDT